MRQDTAQALWQPSAEFAARSGLSHFLRWLADERDIVCNDYAALWRWSVDELDEFWRAIWDYFDVQSSTTPGPVLGQRDMPGAQWFPGTRVNFAWHVLRQRRPGAVALVHQSELRPLADTSWTELADDVATLGEFLRRQGVHPGDRVAAVLPNTPEAMTALLASTAIGAVFSSCAPDFGAGTILDRFRQVAPKVLLVCDGYRYGGKDFDRQALVQTLIAGLPEVETIIFLPYLHANRERAPVAEAIPWHRAMQERCGIDNFQFADVPFEHPLWIVYSSGTTGTPKAMVHSHGGVTLEYLKAAHLHLNLGPESRLFFYTTTGWMMFNALLNGLIAGGSVVLYDGHPMAPAVDTLWRLADQTQATVFGASPSFVEIMIKHGVRPCERHDLSSLGMIMLSGSPASPDTFRWFHEHVRPDLWVTSQSGGTDIVSGFVGSVPLLPVYAGEIQARYLGCDVHVVDDEGGERIDEVGELVVKQPMPSMPLYFWGDETGQRYRDAYFDRYPGWWRHGDFMRLNARGGCQILGRSDATLNRHGVRIGTAELYRIVEGVSGVMDSLVLELRHPDGEPAMIMFVAMQPGQALDSSAEEAIRQALRREGSPRHVPDLIVQMPEIPYTLTRKKLEVPLRKILQGQAVTDVLSLDAMANPEALAPYLEWGRQFQHPATP